MLREAILLLIRVTRIISLHFDVFSRIFKLLSFFGRKFGFPKSRDELRSSYSVPNILSEVPTECYMPRDLTPPTPVSSIIGYESIVFTEDEGFIAGGFAKGEYNSINNIFFKSGGQVDAALAKLAFALAEKFSPQVIIIYETSSQHGF